jgi:hypothetical protein
MDSIQIRREFKIDRDYRKRKGCVLHAGPG